MEIEYGTSGPYIEHSLVGNVLNIGSLSIDLEARQGDSQTIIDISAKMAGGSETIMESCCGDKYVANIFIPPKTYKEVDTGVADSGGNAIYEKVGSPFDITKVILKLWKFEPVLQENS